MAISEDLQRSIRQAFNVRGYRGVALLEWLGEFPVWQGDLSEMRDDVPRAVSANSSSAEHPANVDLEHVLAVAAALDELQPRCRETLWLACYEGQGAAGIARELETTNRYAANLIENCAQRVAELASTLRDGVIKKLTEMPDSLQPVHDEVKKVARKHRSPKQPDASDDDVAHKPHRTINARDTRRH